MKRTLSIVLVFVLLLSAFVLASCKGTDKDAQNTAPPPSAVSETAAPTEALTTAPETEAPTADPNPRPDPVTIEWLAGEMQRRYYVGCMNLELMDFSDIMDRNEDTDLFFWDNQLEIDLIKLNLADNYLSATPDEITVQNIVSESETELTADMYVFMTLPSADPELCNDRGKRFQVTVDKKRMIVIGYSEPDVCESRYTNWLSCLASNYCKEGLTWREANKKAYEEIFTVFVYDATAYPRQTPQG